MDAESLARWSAWPAAGCYVVATGLSLLPANPRRAQWRIRIWICGWGCLVLHLLISLALIHHWSWSAAYEHTARRTQLAVGWNWGGGLWFNLATVVVWALDLCLLPFRNRIPSHGWKLTWDVVCQFYLAFMFFNATVVFGSSTARIAGLTACFILAMIRARHH